MIILLQILLNQSKWDVIMFIFILLFLLLKHTFFVTVKVFLVSLGRVSDYVVSISICRHSSTNERDRRTLVSFHSHKFFLKQLLKSIFEQIKIKKRTNIISHFKLIKI